MTIATSIRTSGAAAVACASVAAISLLPAASASASPAPTRHAASATARMRYALQACKRGGACARRKPSPFLIMVGPELALVPAQAGTSATASPLPVIYGLPDGATGSPWSNYVNPQIRPTSAIAGRNTVTLVFDGEWIVFRAWSTWKSANAHGSGVLYVRKLGGGPVRSSRASIHLYRVKRHDGRQYFSRLHFTLRHQVYAQRSATAKFSPRFPPAWIKER
jgi:hypothetical protein